MVGWCDGEDGHGDGTVIAGRYALEREIGRGGMGAVWLGRDEVLGRPVALKRVGLMPGEGGGPDLLRAEREAKLAARLNHPHVVSVFDLVTRGDERWLVMEYVEGVTLAGLVQQEGPLTPDRAAPLIRQAAEALTAAHGAGIVHRDVKPSNIMVTSSGQVKLADFGIARAEADATLTVTGLVTGSPAYLAPEVASGRTATEASDVWSLGATLFHALAGHPPYQVGDNVVGALYRIVHEEPPRLERAGWLAPLLEATMTRDPADRWTMRRVGEHLARGAGDAEPTRVLPAAPEPLGTTAPPPARPPAVPPVTPATAPRADPQRRRPPADRPSPRPADEPAPRPADATGGRRRWLPVAAVAAAVLLVALLVGLFVPGEDDGGPSADPSDDRSAGSSPDGATSSDASPPEDPSSDPASEASPTRGEQRAAMVAFVEDYLAEVTSDPASTWQRLTPAFQAESGSFASYRQTWLRREIESVGPVRADPDELTVSYRIRYDTFTDDVVLQLQEQDGTYLIAGEPV